MSVKHISEVPSVVVQDAVGVNKQVLISAEEAPHFAMRCFTIPARRQNAVAHQYCGA
jgi:hypothetical protein